MCPSSFYRCSPYFLIPGVAPDSAPILRREGMERSRKGRYMREEGKREKEIDGGEDTRGKEREEKGAFPRLIWAFKS